jgi:hypothetical protein
MIPRPAHIQGQFGKGIEPRDFRWQKVVDRVADAGLFAHGFSCEFVLHGIPGCCGGAAKVSLTSICASFRMRFK